jgi:hypothetical protein
MKRCTSLEKTKVGTRQVRVVLNAVHAALWHMITSLIPCSGFPLHVNQDVYRKKAVWILANQKLAKAMKRAVADWKLKFNGLTIKLLHRPLRFSPNVAHLIFYLCKQYPGKGAVTRPFLPFIGEGSWGKTVRSRRLGCLSSMI